MGSTAGTMPVDDERNDDGQNTQGRHHGPSPAVRRVVIIVVVVIVAVVALAATLLIQNQTQQDRHRIGAARASCTDSAASLTKARSSLSNRVEKAGKDGLLKLTADDVADSSTVSDFQKQVSSAKTALKKAKKPASCAVSAGSPRTQISSLSTARKKNQAMTDSLTQQEKRLKAVIEALTKSRDAKKKSEADPGGQTDGGTTGSDSGSGASGSAGSGSGSSGTGSADSETTTSQNGGSGNGSLDDGLGAGSPVRKDKNSPYKPNLDKIPEQPR